MKDVIAIRKETKSTWERRVPLTPEAVRHLVHDHDIRVLVQSSPRRVFADKEFIRAGAEVGVDISEAPVVFGVKEIPADLLEERTTYIFFSHVIKGQPYNMAMLQRLLDLECTLIDYEAVRDDQGRRLIFFGRFAGLAGMIDTLWALGRRWQERGIRTPFATLEPAHGYPDLESARTALKKVGREIRERGLPAEITPLTIGVAGYGNVAKGAQEILSELPFRDVKPDALEALCAGPEVSDRCIYRLTYREKDLVEPIKEGAHFDLQEYYESPERYRGTFERHLEHLTVVVNANYWDERYPKLITKSRLRELFSPGRTPKLDVIGDLGCDIEGNVECTMKCTEPGDPVFTWDPASGEIASGFSGPGPAVLAVDILPTELPRESSEEFTSTLGPFAPAIASADYTRSFEDLDLPPEVKRAVIVHRGELTPEFASLEEHLPRS